MGCIAMRRAVLIVAAIVFVLCIIYWAYANPPPISDPVHDIAVACFNEGVTRAQIAMQAEHGDKASIAWLATPPSPQCR